MNFPLITDTKIEIFPIPILKRVVTQVDRLAWIMAERR
jgi:hypothetical protein